jgi:hypothetical protein
MDKKRNKMNNEEKIDLARINWIKASDELGFNITSPYYIIKDDRKIRFFAFIPQYGSPRGTLIDLIFSPAYETNNKIQEIANALGYFHSYINVDAYIDYNPNRFLETIDDWGKY